MDDWVEEVKENLRQIYDDYNEIENICMETEELFNNNEIDIDLDNVLYYDLCDIYKGSGLSEDQFEEVINKLEKYITENEMKK